MSDNFGLKIGLEGEKEFKKSLACAKPCSLFPPPAALLSLCHRLRSLTLSISGNKKALPEQCLNGSPCWT